MRRSISLAEFMVIWSRATWPDGKTKNKKFAHLKNAQRLANALADGSKPGVAPATTIEIRQRLVGEWVIVARKGGA